MALDTTTHALPVARSIEDLRETVAGWRAEGLSVGFVPTMGALHIGHLTLMDIARHHADRVVVSIFVNQAQFAPHEDFDSYPRQEADDAAKLADLGVDLLFAPNRNEMYPEGFATSVAVTGVTDDLETSARPHFFGGVATVVTKLLLQAQADVAVFGQKDFQQLLTIRRLARDLDIPTEIIGGPTAREADGLAVSSRNAYLSDEERQVAGQLNKVLHDVATSVAGGAAIDEATATGIAALLEAGFDKVDYLEVRDAETLRPVSQPLTGRARALVAATIGKTRLIDNMAVEKAE